MRQRQGIRYGERQFLSPSFMEIKKPPRRTACECFVILLLLFR